MSIITQHAPGTFCWAELATTDQKAATKFYSDVFGWEPQENDMGGGMTYTILKLRGHDAGALYSLMKEQQDQGVPPHWMTYVAVENADQAAEKAKQLGATIIAPPMDVMEHGRMAVIQDPSGAIFSVWQPKKHPGFGVYGEPGAMVWNELITSDTAKAGSFYTGMFGYATEKMPSASFEYTILKKGENSVGGMMPKMKEMGNAPSHWLIYFSVADTDQTAAKVQQLGGKVIAPPTDIPNIGRFAVFMDPQGAAFAVIKTQPM